MTFLFFSFLFFSFLFFSFLFFSFLFFSFLFLNVDPYGINIYITPPSLSRNLTLSEVSESEGYPPSGCMKIKEKPQSSEAKPYAGRILRCSTSFFRLWSVPFQDRPQSKKKAASLFFTEITLFEGYLIAEKKSRRNLMMQPEDWAQTYLEEGLSHCRKEKPQHKSSPRMQGVISVKKSHRGPIII
jgi:hypothetical protein